MTRKAIQIDRCTKTFGRTVAVQNVSIELEEGQIYGFVGDNGAGKTTTIKMMLGMLYPNQGTISLLELDPWKSDIALKNKIGFMSENREMYDWMTVKDIVWFQSQFYETWDSDYVEKTREMMELPPDKRVKHLSRGMRAKLALLLAVGHHPELLILDEPSSGLDAVVRREILEHVIEHVNKEGNTVFFSSHLLDEVERVADRVGILCKGRLLRDEPLDKLKETTKRIRVTWNGEIPDHQQFKQVIRTEYSEREETYFTDSYSEELLNQFKACNPHSLDVEVMSLEEIFVDTMRSSKNR
jgi:ABC-2 type transport system ATP-binding protein